jgi:hypothetical protein
MSWGLGLRLKIALGIWAALFVAFVIPLAILNDWKVGSLPVVEGSLSNHHVVVEKTSRRTFTFVKATLEFDGPHGHCKHNEVVIGNPHRPESFAAKVQVAVRRDSCYGYYLLPHDSPSMLEWIVVFVLVGLLISFIISFMYFVDGYPKARRSQYASRDA